MKTEVVTQEFRHRNRQIGRNNDRSKNAVKIVEVSIDKTLTDQNNLLRGI